MTCFLFTCWHLSQVCVSVPGVGERLALGQPLTQPSYHLPFPPWDQAVIIPRVGDSENPSPLESPVQPAPPHSSQRNLIAIEIGPCSSVLNLPMSPLSLRTHKGLQGPMASGPCLPLYSPSLPPLQLCWPLGIPQTLPVGSASGPLHLPVLFPR